MMVTVDQLRFATPFACRHSQRESTMVNLSRRQSSKNLQTAIKAQVRERLMQMLTFKKVEEAVTNRVEIKKRKLGQEINIRHEMDDTTPVYKIKPDLVAALYGDWIMPLTKE